MRRDSPCAKWPPTPRLDSEKSTWHEEPPSRDRILVPFGLERLRKMDLRIVAQIAEEVAALEAASPDDVLSEE
jgi:hypothetical protein